MGLGSWLSSLFGSEPKPYHERARHPCPFYGFNGMYGMLIDQGGNQCGLLRESHSPCQMEVGGDAPNWESCLFNNDLSRRDIEEEAPKLRAFPKEFWPPGKRKWGGISLKQWIDHVME